MEDTKKEAVSSVVSSRLASFGIDPDTQLALALALIFVEGMSDWLKAGNGQHHQLG